MSAQSPFPVLPANAGFGRVGRWGWVSETYAKNGLPSLTLRSMNATARRVISASISRRCSTSYTFRGRLFRPLAPSMIYSGGAMSLEYPGAEGHNASSVVQGMPNHSSEP